MAGKSKYQPYCVFDDELEPHTEVPVQHTADIATVRVRPVVVATDVGYKLLRLKLWELDRDSEARVTVDAGIWVPLDAVCPPFQAVMSQSQIP